MELRTKPTVHDGIVHSEGVDNALYVEYEPGNGTVYRLMLTSLEQFSESTTDRFGSSNREGCVVVSDLNNRKCMVVGNGAFIHHTYIEEKMRMNRPDAVVIAELLGWVLDIPSTKSEDFDSVSA